LRNPKTYAGLPSSFSRAALNVHTMALAEKKMWIAVSSAGGDKTGKAGMRKSEKD